MGFRESSTNRVLRAKRRRNESTLPVEREGVFSQANSTKDHMAEERVDDTEGIRTSTPLKVAGKDAPGHVPAESPIQGEAHEYV